MGDEAMSDFLASLVTVGEGGSIAAIAGGLLFMLIKMLKKNGCTCKIKSCKGEELVVVDCEEGAPAPRHRVRSKSEVEISSTKTKEERA